MLNRQSSQRSRHTRSAAAGSGCKPSIRRPQRPRTSARRQPIRHTACSPDSPSAIGPSPLRIFCDVRSINRRNSSTFSITIDGSLPSHLGQQLISSLPPATKSHQLLPTSGGVQRHVAVVAGSGKPILSATYISHQPQIPLVDSIEALHTALTMVATTLDQTDLRADPSLSQTITPTILYLTTPSALSFAHLQQTLTEDILEECTPFDDDIRTLCSRLVNHHSVRFHFAYAVNHHYDSFDFPQQSPSLPRMSVSKALFSEVQQRNTRDSSQIELDNQPDEFTNSIEDFSRPTADDESDQLVNCSVDDERKVRAQKASETAQRELDDLRQLLTKL